MTPNKQTKQGDEINIKQTRCTTTDGGEEAGSREVAREQRGRKEANSGERGAEKEPSKCSDPKDTAEEAW